MKSISIAVLRLALTALSIIFLAIGSVAATHPLNSPQGLAVASNGNLYVANNSGNDVLVYSPAHKQITSMTISTGIANPTSVAFDPSGNLWVANAASNAITEYSSKGAQDTAHTITNGISTPYAIAFDGLADLWVNNGYTNLSVYPQLTTAPSLSISAGVPITSIALWQGFLAIGENNATLMFQANTFLVDRGTNGYTGLLPETCFAAAFDNLGNLYCGNQDHSLTMYPFGGTGKTLVTDLGFFPFGLALDQKNGYIYVSDGIGNSIAVYNLSGTLLQTIQ